MSEKCLGIPFDIHCGGVDLKAFPHHKMKLLKVASDLAKIVTQHHSVIIGSIMDLLQME